MREGGERYNERERYSERDTGGGRDTERERDKMRERERDTMRARGGRGTFGQTDRCTNDICYAILSL